MKSSQLFAPIRGETGNAISRDPGKKKKLFAFSCNKMLQFRFKHNNRPFKMPDGIWVAAELTFNFLVEP